MSESSNQWRIIGLLSAGGIFAGSVMPWVDVQIAGSSASFGGIYSGLGFVTILAALFVGAAFVLGSWSTGQQALAILFGAVSAALAAYLMVDLSPLLSSEGTGLSAAELEAMASPGVGLYLTAAGGFVAILAGWQRSPESV